MNILILVLSFVIFSCSSSYEQTSNPSASLTNTKWVLMTLNGKDITTAQGGKDPYIILTTIESKASGSGGCNSFSATYTVLGKKIMFDKIVSTEMFCENIMDTETGFLKALDNTEKYRIKGNYLYLYDSVKVIAKLEAASSGQD